ncbi:MAG TPA: heme-binding domain-containing protein [Kofleriaceae bacterium]
MRFVKRLFVGLAFVIGFFGVIQLVPFGRDHTNPPVVAEPAWDSPATRQLAVRACFDCHSNQTQWPWYSHVAPFSWVVQRNVHTARTVLNFSDWTRSYELIAQAPGSVLAREMPPRSYRMMHPLAQLTEAEKIQLARGLEATFGLPQRN